MNTINSNPAMARTNFRGNLTSNNKTTMNLIDAIDYANSISKASKKQSKVQKDVKQFFNTLKSIKNDKTNNNLKLEGNFYKTQTAEHKDHYNFGYGNFQKERPVKRYADSGKDSFRHIIEIGKNIFGEKKINKPISDLEKHQFTKLTK